MTTKDETDLPPGRHLIKQVIPPVAAAIEEFVERVANGGAGRKPTAVRLLAQIDDAEVATYLVVRTVVNAVAQGLPIHKGANEISDALVHHIEMTQFTAAIQAGR
ncbi:hypothetical protein [Brevundimonas sp.]|uniref:hypothetical protein n=1 Tax=Brevundimonas sp. TaxID=1871086 RepID=UPI00289CD4AC|nr:hypothetical protein [Brevundimonas sp.]